VAASEITQITPELFLQAVNEFAEALADLELKINELNVYPVPDSDTGTNSLVTLKAGLATVTANQDAALTVCEIAQQLARGATNAALGNSGVILASYLSGLADGLTEQVDIANWRSALVKASKSAYESVLLPVQGTMLSIADAVNQETSDNLLEQLSLNSQLARAALVKTTEQLEALKVAGVVDAGAVVLTLFHDAFAKVTSETKFNFISVEVPICGTPRFYEGPAHELMFSVVIWANQKELLIKTLEANGDSIAITAAESKSDSAGLKSKHRVHVHCDNPDRIISEAKSLGEVNDLVLVNLKLLAK